MLPQQKAVNASELILALQVPKSLPEQIAGSFKHNLNQNSLAKKTFLSDSRTSFRGYWYILFDPSGPSLRPRRN